MINNLVISAVTIALLLTSNCSPEKKEETKEATSNTVVDSVQQDATKVAPPETIGVAPQQPVRPDNKTSGIVSHKFASKGCPTVILVAQSAGDTLVLIPLEALMKDYDVDGLRISFNYRLLKRRSNPACDKGVPAEITDLTKK